MNNWGNEYVSTNHNQYSMQPLMPPMCMITDMSTINPVPAVDTPIPLIGPVMPEHLVKNNSTDLNAIENTVVDEKDKQSQSKSGQRDRDYKSDRRDRNYDRDRSRRRSRSRDRHRRDRNRGENGSGDRNSHRHDRSSRRDRQTKWNKPDDSPGTQSDSNNMSNMSMMPGMMAYNMMNNNLMGQPMDIATMQNMGVMTNTIPGVNMMPNMMDPNMIMMNQQLQMSNQPVYLTVGMLLPPIPGTSMPNRREKPPGCRTIFVGGMPPGINEEIVTEMFMRFGTISDVKLHHQGVCHVRFLNGQSVEQSFYMSGYRLKLNEQMENEATTLFIDYALNRDDQNEYEKNKRRGVVPTQPCLEPFSATALASIADKIKTNEEFIEVAPTVHSWLERGECNKKYANQFYSLIQATNNQVRRLFTDKMQLDEDFQTMKATMKEKYLKIVTQFEQVANILTAAQHQRVSDHFTKQQRRNISMWLKITEEVDNIKEEFDSYFDEDDAEKAGTNGVPVDKYEELKKQNENLIYELEGYRNEAYLAKDEAERKFEKFKAQFIAQQALQNPKQVYPPLPPPTIQSLYQPPTTPSKPEPPPPTPDDMKLIKSGYLSQTDAKLISVMTAFLLIHPLGASLEYIVSYVRSILPNTSQGVVSQVLYRYTDLFRCKSSGIGPNIEHKWEYVTFESIKQLN